MKDLLKLYTSKAEENQDTKKDDDELSLKDVQEVVGGRRQSGRN